MRRIAVAALVAGLTVSGVAQDRLAAAVVSGFRQRSIGEARLCEEAAEEVILDAKLFGNFGEVVKGKVDHRRSWSLSYGLDYDDEPHVDWLLLSYQTVYDYSDVWVHPTPENLKIKFEAAVGCRLRTSVRTVASVGMFAHYYLKWLETDRFRPFIDGGIGIIYTDFQRPHQGLRWNFNPRFSIGTDIKRDGKPPYYIALRAHHVSNAGIDEDNVGINSVLLVIGKYF